METFFDFIFDNLFIVILIVSGLIGLFNKSKQEQEEEKRPAQRPKTPEMPKRQPEQPMNRRTTQTDTGKQTVKQSYQLSENSYEQARQQQYEELKSRYQAAVDNEKISDISSRINSKKETEDNIQVDMDLKKKITQKGLMESVVMAEVLGPPRARKPYHNILNRRY